MRRAARVDDNQGQIVEALRRVGCSSGHSQGSAKASRISPWASGDAISLKIVGVM